MPLQGGAPPAAAANPFGVAQPPANPYAPAPPAQQAPPAAAGFAPPGGHPAAHQQATQQAPPGAPQPPQQQPDGSGAAGGVQNPFGVAPPQQAGPPTPQGGGPAAAPQAAPAGQPAAPVAAPAPLQPTPPQAPQPGGSSAVPAGSSPGGPPGGASVLASRHKGPLHDCALSFDGRRLATASAEGRVCIWETEAGDAAKLGDQVDNSEGLRFQAELIDPNGVQAIGVGQGALGQAQPNGQLGGQAVAHEGSVFQLSWAHSKFGRVLASCGFDGRLKIWREGRGPGEWNLSYGFREEVMPAGPGQHTQNHNHSFNTCSFAPWEFGLLLAAGSSSGVITLLAKEEDSSFGGGGGAWQPFGMGVGRGNHPKGAVLGGAAGAASSIKAHLGGVNSITWAPPVSPVTLTSGQAVRSKQPALGPRRFASAGNDNCVRIWRWSEDPQDRKWVQECCLVPSGGKDAADAAGAAAGGKGQDKGGQQGGQGGVSPQHKGLQGQGGQHQASALHNNPALQTSHEDWVRDVAWRPNVGIPSNTLASCSEDKTCIIWTQEMEGMPWHESARIQLNVPIWRVAWSTTGSILSLSCGENGVHLYKESLKGEWELVTDEL